jgi:hypothetical protein
MLQLDIKTEFSYEELDEDINMNQPEDFIKSRRENEVCRLVKSIYGL